MTRIQAQFHREYKVVVLGGGSVGKSALTVQFVQNQFMTDYDPTLEDSYRKQMLIEDEIVFVDVLDTAGQEEYWPMREQYMISGEGFLLVYSIAERSSFREIGPVYEQILRVKDQDPGEVPVIVVGNKCDLEFERQVATSEGRDLAKHFGCQFLETSAKLRLNVDEIFYNLVLNIRERNKGQRNNRLTQMEVGNHPGAPDEGKMGCCGGCVVL